MKNNLILMSDSYKATHSKAYVKGIQKIYSYLEARGGDTDKIVFFGLQYYLKKYLTIQITQNDIDEAELFFSEHFGRTDCFNKEGWQYILDTYSGKLPLEIKAVPEGSLVTIKNVLMTIVNTDDKCFWLTNYVETLLMKIWYSITQSTRSYNIRKDILSFLEKSGTPESIDFKCHDFGYRGTNSEEHSSIGSASHLLSFLGTDSLSGILMLKDYYHANQMCGFSIPATEHSIMCSFGKENEIEACSNFLDSYPDGLIACVSDTYNIYNCCENIWGGVLRDKVISRNGTLVVRPDSGDMFEVVPKCLDILWSKFGGRVNDKGYKVLDSHIRLIQGDGINPESLKELYNHIMNLGWSVDNLAVGSGGGLLMKNMDRDTYKFAIKASCALVNNKWVDLQKDPITDSGKKSKTGILKLVKINGQYETINHYHPEYDFLEDEMITVYKNGDIVKDYTLEEVKQNLNI